MTEHYRLGEDGNIKREAHPDEEDLDLSKALNMYRGVALQIKNLREDLEKAVEREAAMRGAILEALDVGCEKAAKVCEETEGHARAERMMEALNEARLAVNDFELEQENQTV